MIKINKVELNGSSIMLIADNCVSLENLKKFNMLICTCLKKYGCGYTCYLVINGKTLPLLTNSGNNSRIEQLESRKCYKVVYGNSPEHFLVITPMKKACKTVVAQPMTDDEKLSKS